MKRLLLLAAGVLLGQDVGAAVDLPYHDTFPYAEGTLNAVGAPNWFAGNGSATLEIAVAGSAALVSPPGLPVATGLGVRRAPSGTARRSVLQFTSVPAADGNTVYVSLLLEVQTAPSAAQIIGFLDDNSSSQGAPQAGIFLDSGPRVGLGKKSTVPGFVLSTNLSAGPHFVVVRYTFQVGNDRVDLWVDPPADQFGAAVPPTPLGGASGGNDPSSLDYFQFVTPSGAGGVQFIDEFRVGTSWAEVTTSDGTPPVLRPPVITQTLFTPAGLVLRGTNGTTNGNYLIVGSTDVAAGRSAWYSIATNRFDGGGDFDSTNPVSPGDALRFYQLLVGGSAPPLPRAPAITAQPQSEIVTEGQTALFTVAALGTPPLFYQWYFNTSTPLSHGTAATLNLTHVSTNDAGSYSVTVTNTLGAATSAVATLTVRPRSTNTPEFSHVGFAGAGFNLTGGAGGPEVTVATGAELNQYTDANGPYVIYVSGTLAISGMDTHVRPNKTLIGLGATATLTGGGLYLNRATNVIIRNLTIRNSSEDNIGLHYSAHVWIDHCTIVDASDGGIDLTQESDHVTISWCRFYYTGNFGHNFVNLMAASDGETGSIGKLRTTFHHNWWSTNCIERLPSVRFGRAHVFNNYYNAPGNNYCVRSRLHAECRIENNFFENVEDPWEVYITSGPPGKIHAAGNSFSNVTWITNYPATDDVFTPPYNYALDAADAVPALVTEHAGAGKGPFAP